MEAYTRWFNRQGAMGSDVVEGFMKFDNMELMSFVVRCKLQLYFTTHVRIKFTALVFVRYVFWNRPDLKNYPSNMPKYMSKFSNN